MGAPQTAGGRSIHNMRIRTPEVLAFLLLLHSAMFAWQYATQTPMVDFFVFWSVPHTLSTKPVADIYTEQGRRDMGAQMAAEAELKTTSETQKQATYANTQDPLHDGRVDAHASPFLYSVIGLISSGDYDGDQKRFAILSGLCLAASVVMLCYLLRLSAVATLLLLTFLTADFAPVVSDLGVGNINEVQLFGAALFIFFAARSRYWLAGIAIGLATMIKPTTAIVLVLAVVIGVVDKEYRRLVQVVGGALGAAVAAIAISGIYFGNPRMWIAFIQNLSGTLGEGSYPLEKGNYGLAKLLFGGSGPGTTMILVLLLAVFVWVIWSSRRTGADAAVPNAFAAAGVGCAMMLLSSPLAWVHYFVLLIPLLLYVVRGATDAESSGFAASWMAKALAFLPLLLLSVVAQFNLGGNPWGLASAFNFAAVLTVGLSMVQIRRQRLAEAAPVAEVQAPVQKRKGSP